MDSERRDEMETDRLRRELQASLGDRYVIGGLLGSGGTGTVLAADDLKHDRSVAIKVLRRGIAERLGAERFLREIRFAARLSHPHIVPVFDSGEADGLLYYVMPVMEGESLRDLMDREGPLAIDLAVKITKEVTDGLAHAHSRGVVHRDVKPGNILLSGGHARLSDFGIARTTRAGYDTLSPAEAVVGTPGYMSPEQVAVGSATDERSDIYSLSCVFYEMLTGQRPYSGRSADAVYAGQMQRAPPSPRELRSEIPVPVDRIVTRGLATEPKDRFGSAPEYLDALVDAEAPPLARKWVGLGVALVLALVVSIAFPLLQPAEGITDQAGSVVVLPFTSAGQTEAEDDLALDLADELTRQLNRWDSIRAVPQISLAGALFDLSMNDPVLTRLEDGLRAARMVGVEELIAVNVSIRGDSADVTATRFSTRSGRQAGDPLESRGSRSDAFRLAAGITHPLLGLSGSVDDIERLRRQSSNPQALIDYERGVEALEEWRLGEAETHLRSAAVLDSAFAMAHHYLALTLYWQGASPSGSMSRLGPQAAQQSRSALRHSDDLSSRERDHVRALNRFLEGDYEQARATYSTLLQRDSTDSYAWLLQGIVEFNDPWLVRRPDGGLQPRGDLAKASRSFVETTRLTPGFHLGYGHLFDIAGDIVAASSGGAHQGFRLPDDVLIPPWEGPTDPDDLVAFAPIFLDSIVRVETEVFSSLPIDSVRGGALELLESSFGTLRRWAEYAPDAPRPPEELARWTSRQHDLLPPPQSPALLDSLASTALAHLERALSLSPDTAAADHALLGVLLARAGQRTAAMTQIAAASETATSVLPTYAANPYLGFGQVDAALALHAGMRGRRLFWMDSTTMTPVHDGGLLPLVGRLQILAATGSEPADLRAALERIEARFASLPDGSQDAAFLRDHFAPWVATALAEVPSQLQSWLSPGVRRDPIWTAIDSSNSNRVAAIQEAMGFARPEVGEPARSWLLGSAAMDVGDADLSLQLLTRMDSVPRRILSQDQGWGLATLSHFRRAEALDLLGDSVGAAREYQRFLDLRGPGDTAPITARARARLGLNPGER